MKYNKMIMPLPLPLLLLISSLFIEVSLLPLDCKSNTIYQCSNATLMDNKCLMREQTNSNADLITYYHLHDCSSDQTCLIIEEDMGYCVNRLRLKLGGEKCTVKAECYSSICTNNICIPFQNKDKCTNHNQCSYQSYCPISKTQKICTALKGPNELCEQDYECIAGYVCGTTTPDLKEKKCLKELSIDKGAWVSHRLLCKSAFIHKKTYDPFSTSDGYCSESELQGNNEDCTADSDCLYAISGKIEDVIVGKCQCSLSGSGFCEIGTSNEKWKQWLSLYTSTVNDIKVTEDQNVNFLRANSWGNSKLRQAYQDIVNYARFKNLDSCAIRYLSSSKHLRMTTNSVSILLSLTLILTILY